jgi:hypothetical protein
MYEYFIKKAYDITSTPNKNRHYVYTVFYIFFDLQKSQRFVLHLSVSPVNDPPELSLSPRSIIMFICGPNIYLHIFSRKNEESIKSRKVFSIKVPESLVFVSVCVLYPVAFWVASPFRLTTAFCFLYYVSPFILFNAVAVSPKP